MRRPHVLGLTAAAASVVVLTLGACTSHAPSASPSAHVSPTTSVHPTAVPSDSAAPTPTPSSSPSPSPTLATSAASIQVPSSWKAGTAADIAAVAADPDVTEVLGVWTLPDGTQASVVVTSNPTGTTDTAAYFAKRFGKLGAADGVDVAHTNASTSSGAPLLLVSQTPAGGLGGDAQAMFFVLSPDAIVQGVATTSSDAVGDVSAQLKLAARTVAFN